MRDIAEYALGALMKAGADKAACRAASGRTDEFNLEANKFTLLRTTFDDSLWMKAIVGGRKGMIALNRLDRDSIDAAVVECLAAASAASADEAEDIAPRGGGDFDRRIGGADMGALFTRSKEFLAGLADEFPSVTMTNMATAFKSGSSAYVNSNGAAFTDMAEFYSMGNMFSAKEGEKASSFCGYGFHVASLDKPFMDVGLQRVLLDESRRSVDPRMFEGKFTGKVIVTPSCAGMLWGTMIGCFLSDKALIDGTSRWKDSLGAQVADPKLTVRAAPLNPLIVGGERFTADGFECADADIIRDGDLKSFALSLYGANKTGKPRAANSFGNLEVVAGDVPLAEMIRGVDRGILMNRFSGGSPGPSGDLSGVAKNSFLIEGGKVTAALKETMVSFNLQDALRNIAGISCERNYDGRDIMPWLCFDGITISGR